MSVPARLPKIPNFGESVVVTIVGSLVEDFGIPIPTVRVSLLDGEIVLALSDSNEDGEFRFNEQSLKVGYYDFRASTPGFTTAEERVLITKEMDKTTIYLALRLQRGPDAKGTRAGDLRGSTASQSEVSSTLEIPRLPGGASTPEAPKTGSIPVRVRPEKESSAEHSKGGGPLSKRDTAEESSSALKKPKYVQVEVFYSTDRTSSIESHDPKRMFTSEWAGRNQVSFGKCNVQLPYNRKTGNVPRPSVLKFEFSEDPRKHVIIKTLMELTKDSFYQAISRKPCALIFVHGYCVTFPEAIYRTAQIVDDIGFEGTPICYSWPSAGHFYAYPRDEDTIILTRPNLRAVLTDVLNLKEIETVTIIAHSMGNRAVVDVLDSLGAELVGSEMAGRLRDVIFAAPDVNAGVFESALDGMKRAAKRLTLYASSKDKPLLWSETLRRMTRAGQGGEHLVVHPSLDSIDASVLECGVLDHSYFGSTWNVLTDIYDLMKYGAALPRRSCRGPENDGKGPYYLIRP
jgi:esterase/lipase superfamily enzyme